MTGFGSKAFGCMAVVAGTLATHVLYALIKDGDVLNPALFLILFGAASIATVAFCATRHFFSANWTRCTVGVAVSYCAWLAILLASGPETVMWLPVIIVVGVPFTAPVLIGAWVGSGQLMPGRRAVRQHPAGDALGVLNTRV